MFLQEAPWAVGQFEVEEFDGDVFASIRAVLEILGGRKMRFSRKKNAYVAKIDHIFWPKKKFSESNYEKKIVIWF